ncbi:MAG: hypothetical protein ACRCTK_01285 [Alphaproteobacteria bacterium]
MKPFYSLCLTAGISLLVSGSFYSLCLTAGISLLVSGCYKASRLSDIGDTTPMTRTQDPKAYGGYKPIMTPMPGPQRSRTQSPSSL